MSVHVDAHYYVRFELATAAAIAILVVCILLLLLFLVGILLQASIAHRPPLICRLLCLVAVAVAEEIIVDLLRRVDALFRVRHGRKCAEVIVLSCRLPLFENRFGTFLSFDPS